MNESDIPARSACAFCNKETVLAVFGIVLGVLFVAMGIDVIRRNRLSDRGSIEGEAVND